MHLTKNCSESIKDFCGRHKYRRIRVDVNHIHRPQKMEWKTQYKNENSVGNAFPRQIINGLAFRNCTPLSSHHAFSLDTFYFFNSRIVFYAFNQLICHQIVLSVERKYLLNYSKLLCRMAKVHFEGQNPHPSINTIRHRALKVTLVVCQSLRGSESFVFCVNVPSRLKFLGRRHTSG